MSDEEYVSREQYRHVISHMNRLGDELQAARERIDRLEQIVETDPQRKAWESLDRSDKIWRIRVHLLRDANGGRAAMFYRDVKHLFNGEPSNGHCYDLMEHAGDAEGFDYGESPAGEKRLTVKTDAVKDERLIRDANKAPQGLAA